MSDLRLKPEFELTGHTAALPQPAAGDLTTAGGIGRGDTAARSARRRVTGTRLRLPTDDGFHLFRVY